MLWATCFSTFCITTCEPGMYKPSPSISHSLSCTLTNTNLRVCFQWLGGGYSKSRVLASPTAHHDDSISSSVQVCTHLAHLLPKEFTTDMSAADWPSLPTMAVQRLLFSLLLSCSQRKALCYYGLDNKLFWTAFYRVCELTNSLT